MFPLGPLGFSEISPKIRHTSDRNGHVHVREIRGKLVGNAYVEQNGNKDLPVEGSRSVGMERYPFQIRSFAGNPGDVIVTALFHGAVSRIRTDLSAGTCLRYERQRFGYL